MDIKPREKKVTAGKRGTLSVSGGGGTAESTHM